MQQMSEQPPPVADGETLDDRLFGEAHPEMRRDEHEVAAAEQSVTPTLRLPEDDSPAPTQPDTIFCTPENLDFRVMKI